MAAINIIAIQIKSGEFEPIDYEVNFGQTGKYPPIRIVLEDGTQINLIGQIDRIDEFDENDDRYIRIIDYKSSDKNINLTEVYYGLQLQLLVYLDAILESAMKIVFIQLLFYIVKLITQLQNLMKIKKKSKQTKKY